MEPWARRIGYDEEGRPLTAPSSGGTPGECVRRIQASLGASVDVQAACQVCGVCGRRRQESEMKVVRGDCGGRRHRPTGAIARPALDLHI